eukprot:gnl/Dysnectes_brevis/1566_a1776_726.p1 GENE.gnl/Dysnectes_brevis/1566_a1776_726~~gnl/Dysnectes_brevis/1566_a1776_726.p1  ORF type:complete len:829 (+),score=297.50 gnl/Dysnectes_brevis/1566_a1776_726:19-2505(+)
MSHHRPHMGPSRTSDVYAALKQLVTVSNKTPSGPSHQFLFCQFPRYQEKTTEIAKDIWKKVNLPLIQWALNDATVPNLELQEVISYMESSTSVFDALLDAADRQISEATKIERVVSSPPLAAAVTRLRHPAIKIHRASLPWAPFMSYKPHALQHLPRELQILDTEEGRPRPITRVLPVIPNPYAYEITHSRLQPDIGEDQMGFTMDSRCIQYMMDIQRSSYVTRANAIALSDSFPPFPLRGGALPLGHLAHIPAESVPVLAGWLSGCRAHGTLGRSFPRGLFPPPPPHPRQLVDTLFHYSVVTRPFIMVTTVRELQRVIALLEREPVIAVDLEHHNERCFMGVTALMQISTQHVDIIIDTLELSDHIWRLRGVFANPSVLKVMHGADMDVVWLARDYRISVVNMFDTGRAARRLDLPYGLGTMLQTLFGFEPDKTEQRSDWSMRPLTRSQVYYARCDTHFLIPAYHRLVTLLRSEGGDALASARQDSARVALSYWQPPVLPAPAYHPDAPIRAADLRAFPLPVQILEMAGSFLSVPQQAALTALHAWRVYKAHRLNEGVEYVMPRAALISLARSLPEDARGIVRCLGTPPVVITASLEEVATILQDCAASKRMGARPQFSSPFAPQPMASRPPHRITPRDKSALRPEQASVRLYSLMQDIGWAPAHAPEAVAHTPPRGAGPFFTSPGGTKVALPGSAGHAGVSPAKGGSVLDAPAESQIQSPLYGFDGYPRSGPAIFHIASENRSRRQAHPKPAPVTAAPDVPDTPPTMREVISQLGYVQELTSRQSQLVSSIDESRRSKDSESSVHAVSKATSLMKHRRGGQSLTQK